MIMKDVGLLCITNKRSSYYFNAMLENDLLPALVILLKNEDKVLTPGQLESDLENSFLEKLKKEVGTLKVIPTTDVNSPELISELKQTRETIFIYSGPGGAILKNPILTTGKKFIHVHPGDLPAFRGCLL